ncbi:MAG: endonuclease III [Candidatus Magnetoglobus multicellularis str. Araruama]|uniref:Endonuclease III n=1 Tax=Candidatus Magnetoglobus multicellularis str. Araruama TaxID=890399 RepID=A0A1V1PEX5_9BACT|nr:MAG: endonuclease III [Candidatus Magnetoglobus multicellularis str. Araruama]
MPIISDYRIKQIQQTLKMMYPEVKTQLYHHNAFELLIATILSAQCTDRQVNAVTPKLFHKLKTPQDFIDVKTETLEKLIYTTGFFHNKAKNIKKCCEMLQTEYDSQVPKNLKDLVRLPGVGRKTANVVLGSAFGQQTIVVDTHVGRISQRLGLTKETSPEKIESDLMTCLPKKSWNDFSLHLIHLGRQFCKASRPDCENCPLSQWCEYNQMVVLYAQSILIRSKHIWISGSQSC